VSALKAAQIWLRETTHSGFYTWVQQCSLLSDDWRKKLTQFFQIKQNKEGADFRPYESPYHWAAFCIVGQGEQKMPRDIEKIEAFKVLLSREDENFATLLDPYRQELGELQVGDNDQQNATAIETWLEKRSTLLEVYKEQLNILTEENPLLGQTQQIKGVGGSKSNPKGSTLQELLKENAQKRNTPEPPTPPSKS
jgi:hypothetical protein